MMSSLTNTSLSSCSDTVEVISMKLSGEASVSSCIEVFHEQKLLKLFPIVNFESSAIVDPRDDVLPAKFLC